MAPRSAESEPSAAAPSVRTAPSGSPVAQHTGKSTVFRSGAPKLLVVVDTEEEFDWRKPHSRSETRVDHMKYQHRAQDIFARYGLRPTYVIDYPVASQEVGYRALREWLADGSCVIGAHLHPWVSPPHDEQVSARNSYPGNLPADLEKAKLARLTDTIEANFGRRPTIYRAGRYGIGPNTGAILEELGYEIDTSVVPFTDFRQDGGPDFTDFDVDPYWFGPSGRVLEIPLSVAWRGRLGGYGRKLQSGLLSPLGMRLHLPGILARTGMLERIKLTPEGNSFAELKRLVDAMLAANERLFVFSYHSPSVAPGNTPYVRSDQELQGFLGLIDRFCEYFFGACGGQPSTPHEILALAR